jgi:hypothetical protein
LSIAGRRGYWKTGLTQSATDVTKGAADRFRSLPIWRPAPIAGALLGDVARYLLAATLIALLGLAMGFRPGGGALGVVAGIGLVLLFAVATRRAQLPSATSKEIDPITVPMTVAQQEAQSAQTGSCFSS